MGYVVKLDDFEGPLEVLLQLISKAKLSVEDVSISEITGQYMNYIEHMQEMDMEITSEFLLMASTLLYIKSCKLLPDNKASRAEPDDDLESDLKIKLMEYSKIKQAATSLEDKALANSTSYYKVQMKSQAVEHVVPKLPVYDSRKLSEAMARIADKIKKVPQKPVIHTVKRDTKTFKVRINELKLLFEKCKRMAFFDLFTRSCNRFEVVLTFMAVLKMASDGMLELFQTKPFTDVIIRRKESGWAKLK